MSALTMLEIIRTRLARARSDWDESQTRSNLLIWWHFLRKTGACSDGAGGLVSAGAVRRLVRRQDGAVAVEFGLVAAPFLALVFAIMETAVIFFAGQALETAVADSSRLIMTGQAQTGGYTAATFKDAVCAKIFGLFDCKNGVFVDVQKFTSFASISNPSPVDAQGNFTPPNNYNPGGPGDIVLVRLFYKWPVYVSLLGLNLSNVSGGKRLLAATAAFRNEPYAN
jgi:Flp pilus assembly protein TadG